jgi:hypothetical protein
MFRKITILTLILLLTVTTLNFAATDLEVNIALDYTTNKVTLSGALTGLGDWVTLSVESPTNRLEYIGSAKVVNGEYEIKFGIQTPVNGGIYNITIKAEGMSYQKNASFEWDEPTPEPDDYGDTPQAAYSVEVGNTISGRINFAGDVDVFVLTPEKDVDCPFEISSEAELNAALYMSTNLDTPIADGATDSSGNLSLSANLNDGQTYCLLITGNEISSYTVKIGDLSLVKYTYDENNRIQTVTFNGKTYVYTYSDTGNLISRVLQ